MPSLRVAEQHQLVLSHGNGPQVGLLALQAAAYNDVEAYPLDVLGAQTEGMIGYLIEQELGNLLPPTCRWPRSLTMVEVDADDPAFKDPTKFVGPHYDDAQAASLAEDKGWAFKRDGDTSASGRSVAGATAHLRDPSHPLVAGSRRRGDLRGRWGHPDGVRRGQQRILEGVEAVIDKDFASELLAREVDADLFVMATDVDGVYEGWGTPDQRRLDRATPNELRSLELRRGFDGTKGRGRSALRRDHGTTRAIGALEEIEKIVVGTAGTTVVASTSGSATGTKEV